jgi:hypothetical protein
MSESIPTQALSEALQEQIAGRRVVAAVFTTFRFEPGFFEQEVLPVLFDQSFSHAEKVRLVQLEELVRQLEHVAVYYDRRGLIASGAPASLDVQRIPTTRNGYFHPKLILLLVEDEDDDGIAESLIVGVTSANLTRAGWWENVECAWIEEVADGDRCAFRRDLMSVFSSIRDDERTRDGHVALDRMYKFMRFRVNDSVRRTKRGVLRPRLFGGQQPLPEFVDETLRLPADTYNLEIISPYFDGTDEAGALRTLVEVLAPKETRVFLPEADDGSAICRLAFFEAVSSMPTVQWGRLPGQLLRRGKGAEDKQTPRFVHAKVYRLWSRSERREFFLIGSANLTHAGHSRANAGNLEVATLFEVQNPGRLQFWLEPLDSDPVSFRAEESMDEEETAEVPPLVVRYLWSRRKGEYFWEDDAPPKRLVFSSYGPEIAPVDGVKAGGWFELPEETSEQLGELLKSTSFLDVTTDGTARGTILVREEGMAHKPSILLNLTAEEILRYWALLSAEQREAFHEDKLYDLLVARGLHPPKHITAATSDSMFDRFAGIFHAFSQLEQHVAEALDERHDTVAVYRLFGEKYDSLPHLVEKVSADEEGDAVTRYVTLLTARHLLRRLERDYEDFFAEHREDLRRVTGLLDASDRLHGQLGLADSSESRDFLDWFERMFLTDAKRVEESQRA